MSPSRFASLYLLALCAQSTFSANKISPVSVDVLKCCRIGETLLGDADNFYCEPGGSRNWVPLIYAPRRQTYLNKGSIPQHWNIVEAKPECRPPLRPVLVRPSRPNFSMMVNGSLWMLDTKQILPPSTFCVDSSYVAIACLENDELSPDALAAPDNWNVSRRVRVKKCCGEGAAYSETDGACIANWNGKDLTAEDVRKSRNLDNGTFSVQLVSGFPSCASSDRNPMVIAGNLKDAVLESDGGLQVSVAGVRLAREHFCLETLAEQGETGVFACSDSVPSAARGDDIDRSDLRFTLYPVGLLVSTVFLVATLAAAFLLRSTHHALHWRCQMHYIGCLLVGDLMLAITQLAGNSISGTPCIMIAVIIHFFFLAAFFWLNTMCFNIWWTFRDFRPTTLEKRQEVCRLRFYEVFAWGGPLLIAGVALLLDRLPPDPNQSFLRPRFGVKTCWFYGDLEILTFFFGPIGILLGINLLLFASTARQLTCGLWKREDVKSTTERAALGRVCMKLVVVMGVTWIADVVSWAVGGPSYLWYMTDLINALQGVLIFIVVGCQPQVWAAVKKMWCLKLMRSNATNTTGAPMHSSSQGLPSMGDSVTNNTIANTNTSVKIPMETVC